MRPSAKQKSRPATRRTWESEYPSAGEVERRQLHRSAVRGFRRGNNVNNTNLSPLYVNANNAPSNANTNIAFGNCKQAYGGSAAVTATPYKSSVAPT